MRFEIDKDTTAGDENGCSDALRQFSILLIREIKALSLIRSAFTLIEMLMVVSITIILAALLFPALQKAKDNASQMQCMNNLKNIGYSFASYAGDYNGFLPGGATSWAYYNAMNWSSYGLEEYSISKRKLNRCPARNGKLNSASDYWYIMWTTGYGASYSSAQYQGEWIRLGKTVVQDNPDRVYYDYSNWIACDGPQNPSASYPNRGQWHKGRGINTLFYDNHVKFIVAQIPKDSSDMQNRLFRSKKLGLE